MKILKLLKSLFIRAYEPPRNGCYYSNPYVFRQDDKIYVISYDQSQMPNREDMISEDIMKKVYDAIENEPFKVEKVYNFYLDIQRLRAVYHQFTYPNDNRDEFYELKIKSDNPKINLTYQLIKL